MKIKTKPHSLSGALFAGALLLVSSAGAEEVQQAAAAGDQSSVYRAVGLGAAAAFAIAVSVLGAGYAVGRVGSAALGAAANESARVSSGA